MTPTIETKATAAELRIAGRHIPKGSTKVEHRLAVCYITDAPPTAIGYIGTAGKRTFYTRYRTIEQRDKDVAAFFAGLETSESARAEYKAGTGGAHTVKVGDIIHHSWGYDQTQCDYYQVLAVTLHGATIQAISSKAVEGSGGGSSMSEMQMPVRDEFHGEPLKVRINGYNRVTTLEHGSATLWDGRAKYCSWYA